LHSENYSSHLGSDQMTPI